MASFKKHNPAGWKYILPGEDFYSVGLMYSYGENPTYIIRTLTDATHEPQGLNIPSCGIRGAGV